MAALGYVFERYFSEIPEGEVAHCSAKANCENQPEVAQHNDQHENVRYEHLHQMKERLDEMRHVKHLFSYAQFHGRSCQFSVGIFQNSLSEILSVDEQHFAVIF